MLYAYANIQLCAEKYWTKSHVIFKLLGGDFTYRVGH